MPGKNAIRLHTIILLYFRNELRLEELQKVVCAPTRRKSQLAIGVFVGRLRWGQISRAISVRDADYDQLRNTTVLSQEFNRARCVAHVSITVRHVKHGIT